MDETDGAQLPGDRFLRDLLDIFVNPEIGRRRQAGTLSTNFELQSAQVIMNVGETRIIRLNEEVRALMKTKLAPDARPKKGAQVYWDEIEGIEEFHLTEQDPNAGHATMFRIKGQWLIFFDFRYNAQRITEVLGAADQFLATAEYAKEHGHRRSFMENLFATAELTAKAKLMMLPDEHVLTAKSHAHIRSKINRHAHLGNIDADFVALLNRLERERGNARYVAGRVDLDVDAMNAMFATIKKTLDWVKARTPKRISLDDLRSD